MKELRITIRSRFAALTFLAIGSAAAAGDTVLTGTVVDDAEKPVAGVEIGDNWQLGLETKADSGVKTAADGTFTLTLRYFRPPIALLAMDEKRERGAAVVLSEEDAKSAVSLKLAPVAIVRGEFFCADKDVSPAGSSVQWQFGKARIGNLHAVDPKWEVKLPPGPWGFWTYHQDTAPFTRNFDVPSDGKEIDLGRLEVAPNTLATLRGKPFPDWKVSDARGVEKTVQPSDYKGKWLLVEFWGFW